jgi:mono/diheme cytochrome c family protein
VVAFEIVDWQKAFSVALAAPDGANDAARRGAAWYGDRCIQCHRMRGAGGERGPDLTTVAARIGSGPFATLLGQHPGWRPPAGDPADPQGAEELWTFLRAVAAAAGPGAKPEAVTAGRAAPEPGAP